MSSSRRRVALLLAPLALAGLTALPGSAQQAQAPSAPAADRPGVRLLGERVLPTGLEVDGTPVGGLSGIDRNARTGAYYVISDDRSQAAPARFYTARIELDRTGLHAVRLTGSTTLRRPDGSAFPAGSVDPEDIREDPRGDALFWTSEGARDPGQGVLIDPETFVSGTDGRVRRTLGVPANLRMSAGERGPRQNEALEGLTLPLHGLLSVSAMEGPLIQDGRSPTTAHGALTRLTAQTRYGDTLAQYAYPTDPVFATPRPPAGFANNGISAILADGPGRYLVLERSYSTGVGNSIRIYRVSTFGASDVAGLDSLAGKRIRPVRKELLADLGDLDLSTVDNIEGMTWGPRLGTGERSLVLVSDDNFSAGQVTQFIALALR